MLLLYFTEEIYFKKNLSKALQHQQIKRIALRIRIQAKNCQKELQNRQEEGRGVDRRRRGSAVPKRGWRGGGKKNKLFLFFSCPQPPGSTPSPPDTRPWILGQDSTNQIGPPCFVCFVCCGAFDFRHFASLVYSGLCRWGRAVCFAEAGFVPTGGEGVLVSFLFWGGSIFLPPFNKYLPFPLTMEPGPSLSFSLDNNVTALQCLQCFFVTYFFALYTRRFGCC